MSFPMPPAPAPTLARKPFDLSMLPPEIQARIAAEGQYTAEDGSTVYADGTYTGAGDSGNDFVGGGYAANPGFLGAPAPTVDGAGLGAVDPASADPFASPQFDRYFTTANAGFPGTPGGVGGGPLNNNPMMEPMLDPFADAPATEVSEPVMIGAGPTVTPPADAVAARRQMGGVGEVSTPGAGYGANRRRPMSNRQVSTRPMPGGRRR